MKTLACFVLGALALVGLLSWAAHADDNDACPDRPGICYVADNIVGQTYDCSSSPDGCTEWSSCSIGVSADYHGAIKNFSYQCVASTNVTANGAVPQIDQASWNSAHSSGLALAGSLKAAGICAIVVDRTTD